MSDRAQRKLAAIVFADVVGYSRLMGADEPGTLAAVQALRTNLIDPNVSDHGGRVVKAMGDGLLLEFPSVVAAVECAVAVQTRMADRNDGTDNNPILQLRFGIHLGDVIVEGDDIFGDGVNIAARIEALADPGGISITDDAHRQVRDRIDLDWTDRRSHEVKNIARPIQIWHWTQSNSTESTATRVISEQGLALPDKPSIAVLAFDNMSGDPEQEYFSDGISEDIITSLSRYRGFYVIARNSSFSFKGQSVDLKQVSQELGVRYVLEGSVRKAGNQVRITAQLIDAVHGNHIWADKFDRELTDLFAVQDEITRNIVTAVAPEMLDAEMHRVRHMDAQVLKAWECAIRAQWYLARHTRQDNAQALHFSVEATRLDASAPLGFSIAAFAHIYDALNSWGDSPAESIAAAHDSASKAVELDPRDAMSLAALGTSEIYLGRHEDAIARLQTAVQLNPSFPWAHGDLGIALGYAGRGEEAVAPIKEAIRLSPRDPFNFLWLYAIGFSYFVSGRYEDGLDWTGKSLQENPYQPGAHRIRAVCLSQLGRIDEAKKALSQFLSYAPDTTIGSLRSLPFKSPQDLDHYLDGLRMAGLPD